MAKSWCGFLPQNQQIKEQWGYLEASTKEIMDALHAIKFFDQDDSGAADPDQFPEAGWTFEPK